MMCQKKKWKMLERHYFLLASNQGSGIQKKKMVVRRIFVNLFFFVFDSDINVKCTPRVTTPLMQGCCVISL